MSDEKPTNVVEFKPAATPKDELYPATAKPHNYLGCQHPQVEVSAKERTLTCLTCKVDVDPLAKIEEWAHKWDRERWSMRHAKELDVKVGKFHQAGGRITVRPSGVVVEHGGRRWASSCSGGMTEQLANALQRAEQDMGRDPKDRLMPKA